MSFIPTHRNDLPYPQSNIHVWLCPIEEIDDWGRIAAETRILTATENERIWQYRHDNRRKLALLSRVMLRHVLAAYGPHSPADWQFTHNAYGKPFLADDPQVQPLHFNLSHTREWVTIAITGPSPVGIDVERYTHPADWRALANRFYHPLENAWLSRFSDQEGCRPFVLCWTLKEAYLKAIGLGLGGGLARLQVIQIEPPEFRYRIADDRRDWGLFLAEIGSSHAMSVCSETSSDDSGAIERILALRPFQSLVSVIQNTIIRKGRATTPDQD